MIAGNTSGMPNRRSRTGILASIPIPIPIPTLVVVLVVISTLAVALSGCVYESDVTDDSHHVDLAEYHAEVLGHLQIIIEFWNRTTTLFNEHEYAACREECKRVDEQNEEYASSIGSFERVIAEASLTESDDMYYDAQFKILHAIHNNTNQSAFNLRLACGYAAEGNDRKARIYAECASRHINSFYANIDRFNTNVNVSNTGSRDFVSPVPDDYDSSSPDPLNATPHEVSIPAEIPDPYYLTKTTFRNTHDEVERLLGKGFITPYEGFVFDCSEMASYIEWKLECHNITAYIATKDNWDGVYGHAWVIVPLKKGKCLAIEPTISAAEGSFGEEMITYDRKYFVYDHLFEDIYDASEFFGADEWDWWNKLELK